MPEHRLQKTREAYPVDWFKDDPGFCSRLGHVWIATNTGRRCFECGEHEYMPMRANYLASKRIF